MDYGKISYMRINDLNRRLAKLVKQNNKDNTGTIYLSKNNVDLSTQCNFFCFLPTQSNVTINVFACLYSQTAQSIEGKICINGAEVCTTQAVIREEKLCVVVAGRTITCPQGLTQIGILFENAQGVQADSITISITGKDLYMSNKSCVLLQGEGTDGQIYGVWEGSTIRLFDNALTQIGQFGFSHSNISHLQLAKHNGVLSLWYLKNSTLCLSAITPIPAQIEENIQQGEQATTPNQQSQDGGADSFVLGSVVEIAQGISAFCVCDVGEVQMIYYLAATNLRCGQIDDTTIVNDTLIEANLYGVSKLSACTDGQNVYLAVCTKDKTTVCEQSQGVFVCQLPHCANRGIALQGGTLSLAAMEGSLCKKFCFHQDTDTFEEEAICFADHCLNCNQGLLVFDKSILKLY